MTQGDTLFLYSLMHRQREEVTLRSAVTGEECWVVARSLLNIPAERPHVFVLRTPPPVTAPGEITLTKLNRRPDLRVANQTNCVCLESKAINLDWRLVSSKGHTGQGLGLASSQLRAPSAAWWRLPLHCLVNQGLIIIYKVSESHSPTVTTHYRGLCSLPGQHL